MRNGQRGSVIVDWDYTQAGSRTPSAWAQNFAINHAGADNYMVVVIDTGGSYFNYVIIGDITYNDRYYDVSNCAYVCATPAGNVNEGIFPSNTIVYAPYDSYVYSDIGLYSMRLDTLRTDMPMLIAFSTFAVAAFLFYAWRSFAERRRRYV